MRVAIVGLGAAGANAARTLAAEAPDLRVAIFGAEEHLYYARPKLPGFLAGEVGPDELRFYDQEWYRQRGIEVHLGAPAERIDTAAHRLLLAGGRSVAYDRLLLATGARPFVPPIEGASLPGVFTLWTVADALAIRAHAESCRHATVIGGGLLGLEAARALRALGLEVTVLEFAPWLMPRQLDQEGAAIFRRHVEGMGIAVRTGVATEAIAGPDVVRSVRLKGGDRLAAELVLIAAGGRADLDLARASGLAVNRGITVDAHLQTSAEDVYAAGDVAEWNGTIYGIVPAAVEQARAAARNLAGTAREEYAGTTPTNTLKIVGLDLTSIGEVAPAGAGYEELRRADGDGRYLKLVLKEGRLRGAILLEHRDKVNALSRAVAQQAAVGERRTELLEDGFDWKSLKEVS